MAISDDLANIMEPVARILLGEPNAHVSNKRELRWGNRGSLAVKLADGTWYDHEQDCGGGVLDLIENQTGLHGPERFDWLRSNGFTIENDWEPPRNRSANGGDSQARAKAKPKVGRTSGAPRGTIDKIYPYPDEQGDVLFEVVRFKDPKDFRQRRPDGHGGYIWSTRDVRQVIYRLPEILEQMALLHTIFVVEGEKDADNLWDIGVPATCNPGGVGKWTDELAQLLAGADIVVIPDNDPQKKHAKTGEPMFHEESGAPILPGQDHAHNVSRSLNEIAGRVRFLDLALAWPDMPLKGDVSDWLHAGGTAEALYALAEGAPDWSPELMPKAPVKAPVFEIIDIRAWFGTKSPERRWAVPGWIPDHNVTLLTGQGGIGKTLLMQQLSVATVLGRDWIGELPEPGPVLFVTAEDDVDELHFRFDRIAAHYEASFLDLADAGLHLVSLAGQDAVMAVANAHSIVEETDLFKHLKRAAEGIKPRWICIDTAADVFVVNERDRSQVRQCISLLRGIALALGTAVILLAHPSLSGIMSGSGLSGSTAWNNSVRSRLYLHGEHEGKKKKNGQDNGGADEHDDEEPPEETGVRILEVMKANYTQAGARTRLMWDNGLLVPERVVLARSDKPLDKVASETRAKAIFLQLLKSCNDKDHAVSFKGSARNNAPAEFAALEIAKELSPYMAVRKRLFTKVMNELLHAGEIHEADGPLSLRPSKRSPCLYVGRKLV